MDNVIIKIEKDSIAQELGIGAGDLLLMINDKQIKDIFDYRYLIQEEYIELLVQKTDGEQYIFEIEKDEMEDLGIVFETGLMDQAKNCSNQCIFCFIDQLPPHMRETLYFKDDDSRLSFLQGNYVTLTNMKQEDLERIIYYHLSPIHISVHTTDPELRVFMLKNRKAGNLEKYLSMLYEANIEMNFQVVLCKNVNDRQHLDKTIQDLSKYIPKAKSLSIVPVGISKYREHLFEMTPFSQNDCLEVVKQIEGWQQKLRREFGTGFVFASDEFYLSAGTALPAYDAYEDFPQLENGVGMISLMYYEFQQHLKKISQIVKPKVVSLVTGKAAFSFIFSLKEILENKFPQVQIHLYAIENIFFGKNITVSGLMTGTDIMEQLKGKELGQSLLIPENALRADDTVFLDDVDVKEIEDHFGVKVTIVKTNGVDFIHAILG